MSEDPRRERELFEHVLGLPPDERDAYLHAQCEDDDALRHRIASLVAAHESVGSQIPEDPLPAVDATDARATALGSSTTPEQIGVYRLETKIGEGGCGNVYLAVQREPVKRRVALKLIKFGLDTERFVSRFEAERQALALMDHPSIARVFDGGATETGRPYLVMEYVEGLPITDYCNAHQLDVRARVRLLRQVSEAVQHAHQKGVLHRDIKPSNVLVSHVDGRPLPKVIDFGLAKAIGAELTEKTLLTEQNQIMGTPEYMSPEQAAGNSADVDTRSDVYALGVLLYELVVGRMPFESESLRGQGILEMRRLIIETDPPRPSQRVSSLGDRIADIARERSTTPSTLTRSLRGDVDWIISKCLEKEPDRRYETAAALAKDLDAYLENRPVEAGPPSRIYRIRKAVRRHRAAFAAAVAVLLALALGITGTTIGMVRAREEARRADRESVVASEARAQAETDAKAARASESRARTAERVAREAETIAREAQAEAERARENEAQARLDAEREAKIAAEVNRFLVDDLLTSADPNHSKSSDITVLEVVDAAARTLAGRFDGEPAIEGASRLTLGRTYLALQRTDAARRELSIARERFEEAGGADDDRTLEARSLLASCDYWSADYDSAEREWLAVLTDAEAALGPESEVIVTTKGRLGFLYLRQARFDEAEPLLLACESLSMKRFGTRDLRTVLAMANVAQLYQWRKQAAQAESKYQETLEYLREGFGDDHPQTLLTLTNLASVCNERRRYDEARAFLEEAVAGQTRVLGREHGYTLDAMNNLAFAYQNLERLDEAEAMFREVFATRVRLLGDDHPKTLLSMSNLGNLLRVRGKLDEAEPLLTKALAGTRAAQGPTHPNTMYCLQDLTRLHQLRERHDLAAATLGEIVEVLRQTQPDNASQIDRILQMRFDAFEKAEDVAGAESVLLERHALHADAAEGKSNSQTRRLRSAIIGFYREHGMDDKADAWAAGPER